MPDMRNSTAKPVGADDAGFEGQPEKPNKILLSNHPKVCDCKKCSMEYCDCSEEQQGTVASTTEYWQKK
jgi:hypothetical protein